MADELAARIGVRADSEYRIRSGILYTLMQAVGEGNCYLPIEKLIVFTLEENWRSRNRLSPR